MMNVWSALKDWRRTIAAIEYSTHQQSLDSRENDLIWLLRSDNPRFRTTVLKALLNLRHRSERLISEVIRIVEDDNADSICRLLAVEALDHLINVDQPLPPCRSRSHEQSIAQLQRLLDGSLPPMVEDAVRQVLSKAGSNPSSPGEFATHGPVSGEQL